MSLAAFLALGAGLILAGVFLCAALAVWIVSMAVAAEGAAWADYIAERPDRVMRRCLMGWGIMSLFVLAKAAGWKGIRDSGWAAEADPDTRLTWFARGAGIGLLSMGAIRLAAVAAGCHSISALPGAMGIAYQVVSILVAGVVVGLVEETVCRGVMFRVIARKWGLALGMIITGVIFALAHFPSPAPESFAGGAFAGRAMRVAAATFASVPAAPDFAVRFVNLAALSVALCAFTAGARTIWLAAGTHAAWVWAIKVSHYLTDYDPPYPWNLVFGERIDATDSWLPVAFSAALALLATRIGFVPAKRIRAGGRTWRVDPGCAAEFLAMEKHSSSLFHFVDGKVLKSYPGCRVVARDGVVIKEYTAAGGVKGLRFALKRGRARRAFEMGIRLRERGIATPAPVAWAVKRRCGLKQAEDLVVRELAGAGSLTLFLKRRDLEPAVRGKILRAYAELAAAFHCGGFSNRDLKDENVMVEPGNAFRLWAVDLDGVGRPWFVTRRRAERDLRRVGLSLAAHGWAGADDQAIFFEAYNAAVPARLARERFDAVN